jgi:hypothetical protein
MNVHSCTDCPLLWDGQGEWGDSCNHPQADERKARPTTPDNLAHMGRVREPGLPPPKECPLRQGMLLVRLEAGR